jgi:hypothetical protein
MHWFWRATIAVVAAAFSGLICMQPINALGYSIASDFGRIESSEPTVLMGAFFSIALQSAISGIVALSVFKILSLAIPTARELETRCRKCQYILKGISEPICPECGEKI